MRLSVLCAIAFIANSFSLCAEDVAVVRAADGFQLPVGPNGTGSGYYIARGYRPNGHLGEDWNGLGGGDTDLGDPVYACANGYVTFARNYHVGWGNVVILRHAYYEGSELKFVDSLYGHLLDFAVHEGEQVKRGQQIGRIGNNFGMYEAHLHFEMRKNLQIGMFRSSFLRDFSNYYTPNEFVAEHHACPHPNSMVKIPINTYPPMAPPVIAGPHVESPIISLPKAGAPPTFARVSPLPPIVNSSGPSSGAKVITATTPANPAVVTRESKGVKTLPLAAVTPSPAPKSTKSSSATVVLNDVPTTPSSRHTKGTAGPSATPVGFRVSRIASSEGAENEGLPPQADATKHPSETGGNLGKTSATAATVVLTEPPSSPTGTPGSKHSKGATAAASPTPTPAAANKHSKTIAIASPSPTPAAKHAKALATVAAAPTAEAIADAVTPTLASSKKTHKAASATPEPDAPPAAAVTGADIVASNPLLPPPSAITANPMPATPRTPTRRATPSYKVDRFEDLRSKGY